MTTLADMTPEQRAQSIGMWCTHHNFGTGVHTSVIAFIQNESVWLVHPHIFGEWSCFPIDTVSPRPNLPRAWTPTGEPVKGEWEDGIANVTGEGATFFDQWGNAVDTEINHITDGNEYQDGQTVARRFITEWEEV